MMEAEVPPRQSDYPQIIGYLRRHPVIHFGVVFCYWFTAVSIFNDLQAAFWQLFPERSNGYRYAIALSMAVISFLRTRFSRRFRGADFSEMTKCPET